MSESTDQLVRATHRTALESALRDYMGSARACDMSEVDIMDDIADIICDASDRAIILADTSIV